ncbi:hypothetical protein [Corallococcus macrosporus]|uniref:Uncharacterized protein n=1 Tax=Corallococcus macrosporus DSM 14697 TaxID=1189310 RepID=A0A250JZB3_9BACT|nr:hypothetical protein [Corallococcus macrosporus]ATB49184.1 hypothetical protein MYMAC_004825 [Corallococcus macrosporus DSM 14697]
MTDEAVLRIHGVIGHGKTPHHPALPAGRAGLAFTWLPARGDQGATVALFGTGTVGMPHAVVYGGYLDGAILVVAIHLATGQVYASAPVDSDVVPLSARRLDPDAAVASASPLAQKMSMTTHFNADLAVLLGLPAEGGDYGVFLWLDDLTTPVQRVHVPENAARRAPAASRPAAVELTVGGAAHAPARGEEAIALEWAPGKARLVGSLAASALDREPDSAREPPPLTVLALCQRSRALGWHSTPVAERMRKAGGHSFEVDPGALVQCAVPPERRFALAVLGGLGPAVAVIPPDEPAR